MKHDTVILAILAPLVLTVLFVGLRIRRRVISVAVGIVAWVIMGIGMQFHWYGTSGWNAHADVENMIFVDVWYGALGGAIQYFATRRSPKCSARFAARVAAFEAAKQARAAKGPAPQ